MLIPGVAKPQKSIFFHLTWRICQNRQYHLICRFPGLLGPCPKPPIHSDSSVPVLFFNMPVPVQRFWLPWGNKNLMLGGMGKGGVYLLGDFSMWKGEIFFQV